MSEPFQIKTQATVYSVRTLVDKGLRVTLDMPEGSIEAAALLMGCQQHGVVLDVTATEQAQADATAGSEAPRVVSWRERREYLG